MLVSYCVILGMKVASEIFPKIDARLEFGESVYYDMQNWKQKLLSCAGKYYSNRAYVQGLRIVCRNSLPEGGKQMSL